MLQRHGERTTRTRLVSAAGAPSACRAAVGVPAGSAVAAAAVGTSVQPEEGMFQVVEEAVAAVEELAAVAGVAVGNNLVGSVELVKALEDHISGFSGNFLLVPS